MKLAICGYPPMALQITDAIANSDVECDYFIRDLATSHGKRNIQFPANSLKLITFSEFRKLIKANELDGLIIAEVLPSGGLSPHDFISLTKAKQIIKMCKFYNIPNVKVPNMGSPFERLYNLDNEKVFIPYLETNLIDSCNLNCKACTHYANLFNDNDAVYKVEDFHRDIKQLADRADILQLRLLGGEPFKLKNLNQYLKIARDFLPDTNIRVVTNGLLLNRVSEKILNSLRENQIVVDISLYPPTLRIFDSIKYILEKNYIDYKTTPNIDFFNVFLTVHDGHNPEQARKFCGNDTCRFLRDGKIYKCPLDALSFRFAERFGLKNFPLSTGVDIFAKNFSVHFENLDENIELCTWCAEDCVHIPWTPQNNPKLSDWLIEAQESELHTVLV